MLEIKLPDTEPHVVADPHSAENLYAEESYLWRFGHLSLVICGETDEALRAADAYGIELKSSMEAGGVTYARATLRRERAVRRWFADGVGEIEAARTKKGTPLTPGELPAGMLLGWCSRFVSFRGILISAAVVMVGGLLLGPLSLFTVDVLLALVWLYRFRSGWSATPQQWATLLRDMVALY